MCKCGFFVQEIELLNKIHREFYVRQHCHLGLKRTETVQNEKRLLGPASHPAQTSMGRKQAEKITHLQTQDSFYGKGRIFRGKNQELKGMAPRQQGLNPNHRTSNMCLAGLQVWYGAVTILFLTFFFIFEQERLQLLSYACPLRHIGQAGHRG